MQVTMTDLSRYFSAQGRPVETGWTRGSYTTIHILQELLGKPFDEVALAYITAVKPTMLRVIPHDGSTTMDARNGRVTMSLDKDGLISRITQEVEVSLPDTISTGHHLGLALKLGIDHPTTQFHYSDPANPITGMSYIFGRVLKHLQDGTTVELKPQPSDTDEEFDPV